MRITLIGSGNTASVLGRKMLNAGHTIQQVMSRHLAHASALAEELSARAADNLKDLDPSSDIFIVAVSDSALENIGKELSLGNSFTVHTAGSVPMDVLKNVSLNYGVLYPLQSLRRELADIPHLPILVDANSEWNKTRLYSFVQSFADSVEYADDVQRRKLHLAAVICNNFSNHLFALTEDYCKREGVEFKRILPLLEESIRRLYRASPADVQTGPAIRNDRGTIEKHLQMLEGYHELRELYGLMTESVGKTKVKS